jgi:predicted flap endonuclease-1-like 5' DNA nuclease
LDQEAFQKFLKRGGRSPRAAKGVIATVLRYEQYLREERDLKGLDEARPQDLEAFVSYIEEKEKGAAKKYLHGIRYYYECAGNKEMRQLAASLRKQRIKHTPFPLRDFLKIDSAHIAKLEALGIRNSNQILTAGKTPKKREELSTKTGVPAEAILELVKLSDLTRIFGVKSIRARLYHDAGVDTIDKMAKWNPDKLRTMLIDFVQKTGFNGIAPLPKEAEFTVKEAKKLPRIIEY